MIEFFHFYIIGCVYAVDIALDEPIRDDGFGGNAFGGEGMDFFDGFGAGEGIVPGFEDLGAEPAPVNEEPLAHDVTLEPLDITLTKEDENEKPKDAQEEEEEESSEAAMPVGKLCSHFFGNLFQSICLIKCH